MTTRKTDVDGEEGSTELGSSTCSTAEKRKLLDRARDLEVSMAVVEERNRSMHEELSKKVDHQRYSVVEKLVFGLVAIILTGVFGVLFSGIFTKW